jgi:hypothetical protein
MKWKLAAFAVLCMALGKESLADTTVVARPSATLNGWGANGHVGAYEEGVNQGYGWGLDGSTTAPYTNPANATDTSSTTFAYSAQQHTHKYSGCIYTFPAVASSGIARTLNIDSQVPASGTDGFIVTSRSAGVWYSINGGSTWTQVYNVQNRSRRTDSITLTASQDLSKVQVMVFSDAHDDMYHKVYDINITEPVHTTGFINPKYVVVGVTYAPPGSSSSVTYANTTMVGNTTNISTSFTQDTGFSVEVTTGIKVPAGKILNGGVNLTFSQSQDYTQGSSTSVTNTISKATTIAYTTPGTPTFSPVNSDYDFIWLWLNPELLMTYVPVNGATPASLNLNGYAFDPTDPVSGQPQPGVPYVGGPDILQVQVGCLTGHFSCPSTLVITNGVVTSGTLARSWAAGEYVWPTGDGPGLTTQDIANILTFDPLVPSNNYTLLSSLPSTTSDGRFTKDTFPPNPVQYAVGGATEAFSLVQMNSQSVASGATNVIKQTFGVSAQFSNGFLGIVDSTTTIKELNTLTWNYSRLDTLNTSKTLTNQLSVKGPPDPPPTYAGPTQFIAYQDNIFGTFAFVPAP